MLDRTMQSWFKPNKDALFTEIIAGDLATVQRLVGETPKY